MERAGVLNVLYTQGSSAGGWNESNYTQTEKECDKESQNTFKANEISE
jgi:hypothetical protein